MQESYIAKLISEIKCQYQQTDVNLDGNVNSEDRAVVWNNRNVVSQVPE